MTNTTIVGSYNIDVGNIESFEVITLVLIVTRSRFTTLVSKILKIFEKLAATFVMQWTTNQNFLPTTRMFSSITTTTLTNINGNNDFNATLTKDSTFDDDLDKTPFWKTDEDEFFIATSLINHESYNIHQNTGLVFIHLAKSIENNKRGSKAMWEQVNKIRGSEKSLNTSTVQHIDANKLNTHFVFMSTDPSYKIPPTKATTINSRQHQQFTPYSVLLMLTKACPSGTEASNYSTSLNHSSAHASNMQLPPGLVLLHNNSSSNYNLSSKN
ncbi:hypothetical protein HELRODRAFT_178616 [Helobdella robusta]|uniref:Uncharacterized protein n=1 Tax=Helobdella robusta TaxID=6412 RepID=T1FDG5_HELRO|nr:hypothetical protein HELRODRAFT_178616 [Helobdella robusta]ESN96821.1 hypothetical protein HELRODRAFT_178616 [Helobdella robusta]